MHRPLEHIQPDIVFVHVWRQEDTRLERLLDDRDGPVRLLAIQLDEDTVGVVINFPNRLYMGAGRREEVDEIRHEDDPETIFRLDD